MRRGPESYAADALRAVFTVRNIGKPRHGQPLALSAASTAAIPLTLQHHTADHIQTGL